MHVSKYKDMERGASFLYFLSYCFYLFIYFTLCNLNVLLDIVEKHLSAPTEQ